MTAPATSVRVRPRGGVVPVFAYLSWCSLRNRLRRQLGRARKPRYLVALLVGVAYVWLLTMRPGGRGPLASSTSTAAGQLMYTAVLFAFVASWWIFSSGEKLALSFSQAEVQLLFPAPLSRRQLVEYKLCTAQIAILVSAVVWLLLIRRGGTQALWMRGIALWVLFSTLYLHRVGASLVRASAGEHGASGVRRHIVPMGIVGAMVVVALWSVSRSLPTLQQALARNDVASLDRVLGSPPLSVVLAPFRLLVAPLFVTSSTEWWHAIWPAALIMLVHYPWVLRIDAAFEEAAAEAAAKRAHLISALRERRPAYRAPKGGVSRTWLPLAPTGAPTVAIVWKNAIAFTRRLRASTFVAFAVILLVIVGSITSASGGVAELGPVLSMLALVYVALLTVFGPQIVRYDLRQDLLQLDLLRAYPVSGAALVRAEIASSAAILSAIQLALGLFAIALRVVLAPDSARSELPLYLMAAIALPAVNLVQMLVANGTALLFPGWVRLGADRPIGLEAMGQSILTTFGSLALSMVLLALPVLAGALVAIPLARSHVWAAAAGALAGVLVVAVECALVVRWLGRVLARTEPESVEGRG